jgi:hypothetical protein
MVTVATIIATSSIWSYKGRWEYVLMEKLSDTKIS